MNKTEGYKTRFGCGSCKYEHKVLIDTPCRSCKRRKGTKWVQKPKPAKYCECCGQLKGDCDE